MIISLKKPYNLGDTGVTGNYWRLGEVSFKYFENTPITEETVLYVKADIMLFININKLVSGDSIYKLSVLIPYIAEELTMESLVETGEDNLFDLLYKKVMLNNEYFSDAEIITSTNINIKIL